MNPAVDRSAIPARASILRATGSIAGRWLLGLAVLSAASAAFAADTVRYVALVDGGKHAGQQVVTRGDDGVTHVDFIFKDNGRGPELKEQYTLAADGTFASYQLHGTSTFGAPVDESFSRDGGHARWKSLSDHGEQARSDVAMYTPLGGSPEAFSLRSPPCPGARTASCR